MSLLSHSFFPAIAIAFAIAIAVAIVIEKIDSDDVAPDSYPAGSVMGESPVKKPALQVEFFLAIVIEKIDSDCDNESDSDRRRQECLRSGSSFILPPSSFAKMPSGRRRSIAH